MATKSGCEIRGCPDYKDGRCVNEEDYVSSLDGEPMCPHNESAVRRIEWVEAELTQAHAERDAAREVLNGEPLKWVIGELETAAETGYPVDRDVAHEAIGKLRAAIKAEGE